MAVLKFGCHFHAWRELTKMLSGVTGFLRIVVKMTCSTKVVYRLNSLLSVGLLLLLCAPFYES